MRPLVLAAAVVYLMGDSEAFLLQHDLRPLVEASGYEFRAEVVPGSSVISWSRDMATSWARLRRARPALLLVSLGANDACMGARIVRNEGPFLRRFQVRLGRVRAGRVVWMGPPAIGSPAKLHQAKEGLELFAKMIESAGIPYLDARTIRVQMWDDLLHCSRPRWYGDPAHGCADWATWIWSQLNVDGGL